MTHPRGHPISPDRPRRAGRGDRPRGPRPAGPRRAGPVALTVLLVGGLGLLAGPAGCTTDPSRGYSFTPTFDESIGTIAVPIFQNDTFATGLEQELTEAVILEIQRRTPYRIAPARSADSVLRGTITAVDLQALSALDETGFVQEQAFIITMSFQWQNNLTGEVLASIEGFRGLSTFVPTDPTGERIERGRRGALHEVAAGMVNELRGAW